MHIVIMLYVSHRCVGNARTPINHCHMRVIGLWRREIRIVASVAQSISANTWGDRRRVSGIFGGVEFKAYFWRRYVGRGAIGARVPQVLTRGTTNVGAIAITVDDGKGKAIAYTANPKAKVAAHARTGVMRFGRPRAGG